MSKGKQTALIIREQRVSVPKVSTLARPQKRRSRGQQGSALPSIVADYAKTLSDPWEYGPVRLGFGTLINTQLGTMYLRNSITVNADGSFGLFCAPQADKFVYTCVAGHATATWVAVAASNAAGLQAQAAAARVVSGGLRCFALFPETAASGVMFGGSLSANTPATNAAATIDQFSSNSTSELGIGSKGARSVMMPIDLFAFELATTTLTNAENNIQAVSTPYIVGLGFPVGTVIWYEAICNLELLPRSSSSTVGLDTDEAPSPGMYDYFPNAEALVSRIRSVIGNSVVMDGVSNLASNYVHPSLGKMIRSSFGSGSHHRSALVSGQSQERHGRQNSVMIEEMKEERSS